MSNLFLPLMTPKEKKILLIKQMEYLGGSSQLEVNIGGVTNMKIHLEYWHSK